MSEHCKACGYRHLHAAWCNARSKEESGMSERQEILSKLERVWDLNPDKDFCPLMISLLTGDKEVPIEYLEDVRQTADAYLLERLDEILDEHENGECP